MYIYIYICKERKKEKNFHFEKYYSRYFSNLLHSGKRYYLPSILLSSHLHTEPGNYYRGECGAAAAMGKELAVIDKRISGNVQTKFSSISGNLYPMVLCIRVVH